MDGDLSPEREKVRGRGWTVQSPLHLALAFPIFQTDLLFDLASGLESIKQTVHFLEKKDVHVCETLNVAERRRNEGLGL